MVYLLPRLVLPALFAIGLLYSGLVTPIRAGEAEDEAYLAMVDLALAEPTKVNFFKLRAAYRSSRFFLGDRYERELAKFHPEDYDSESTTAFIREHYGNLATHAMVFVAYDPPDQRYFRHYNAANQLYRAILTKGTGHTREEAMEVLSFSEERVALASFQVTLIKREYLEEDGKAYHLVDVVGDHSGEKRQLWFDISAFCQAEDTCPVADGQKTLPI